MVAVLRKFMKIFFTIYLKEHKSTKISSLYGLYLAVILILMGCVAQKADWYIPEATSKEQCLEANGDWYNEACWQDFGDDRGQITPENVDGIAEQEKRAYENAKISLNGVPYPVDTFLVFPRENSLATVVIFDPQEKTQRNTRGNTREKVQFSVFALIPQEPIFPLDAEGLLFEGNIIEENPIVEPKKKATGTIKLSEEISELADFVRAKGSLQSLEDPSVMYDISYVLDRSITGWGDSTLVIKGREAYLDGLLGTKTYIQMRDMIRSNPQVDTVVLGSITGIPGSINDSVNMHTGRILREAGLATKVTATSKIYSGGVDLFAAGAKRIAESGAEIGVHSWCCIGDVPAEKAPKEHPAHQYQLAYYTMALGKDLGADFYFYTLEASPFEDVHLMTKQELLNWTLVTDFIE